MKLTQASLFQFLGWNTQGDLGPFTFYTNKQKKLVFFIKAPPLEPPSHLQTLQRTKFRMVAAFWKRHTPAQRANWELATKRLTLNLTGYNLFTWYYTAGDRQTLATIERQANVTLVDD